MEATTICDPLTIAGIALTAGSTVVNTIGQNKANKARADVMAAERVRQSALEQEAAALNVGAQNRYPDFGAQQERKATELGDYFAGQGTATAGEVNAEGGALPTSASNIVVQEEGKQQAKARDYVQKQGAALGNLRAFGDVLGGISREQARDASLIGQIGGFKEGSSGILPYELESASQKGAGLKQLGDVLNIGGQLAMGAGLSGGNLPSWLGGSTPKVIGATAGDAWSGLRNVTTAAAKRSKSLPPLSLAGIGSPIAGLYGGR